MYADEDDDQDLRAAIAASLEQPQPEAASPAASAAQQDLWASGNPEVLTGFSTRFRCYAAAAVGRKDIDATGKILLPQSALHVLLAKLPEMPSTLLLCLSHEGSSAYCGVAEFLEDAEMSALLTRVAGQAVRSDELPRFFRGGPLAVCFVPRWVNPNPNPNPNAIPNPNPNPNANPNHNPNPKPNPNPNPKPEPRTRTRTPRCAPRCCSSPRGRSSRATSCRSRWRRRCGCSRGTRPSPPRSRARATRAPR